MPETATVLMSGGIAFGDLNEEQVNRLPNSNMKKITVFFAFINNNSPHFIMTMSPSGVMIANKF